MSSRLAGYLHEGQMGRIWINENIPSRFRRIKSRKRVHIHESVERRLRMEDKNMTQRKAHKMALKAEHGGLSLHGIAVHEGNLGHIARFHPHRKGKK